MNEDGGQGGQDFFQPMPQIIPAQSDQEYLRTIEAMLRECETGKKKLALLIEWCDTGISILNQVDDEEAEGYLTRFVNASKTAKLSGKYAGNASEKMGGMVYNITVDGSGSSFACAKDNYDHTLEVAIDSAYMTACKPFIELKNGIRSRLKMHGIILTFDFIGEMTQRLKKLKGMSADDMEKAMLDTGEGIEGEPEPKPKTTAPVPAPVEKPAPTPSLLRSGRTLVNPKEVKANGNGQK